MRRRGFEGGGLGNLHGLRVNYGVLWVSMAIRVSLRCSRGSLGPFDDYL